uniref:Uncharacterized protein n=1 Tax=Meloidogyne enterolobii TaxID=390850 RepID=A0A6V7Y256_MELEN|nr:unnamed protein product [Meloidogyne enterolobii]
MKKLKRFCSLWKYKNRNIKNYRQLGENSEKFFLFFLIKNIVKYLFFVKSFLLT